MDLEARYQKIKSKMEHLTDFPQEEQQKSRDLFDIKEKIVVPRHFEVWTALVGLPVPALLTTQFQELTDHIYSLVSPRSRIYRVIPQNYHWELFIIKRPNEVASQENLQVAANILRRVLASHSPLCIEYRGFLVTQDGTILAKGYGDFDNLRLKLRQEIPFASQRQSNLGHISLGRILDPVGKESFTAIKSLVQHYEKRILGEMWVREAKYVHETQWYMESREVIEVLAFKS